MEALGLRDQRAALQFIRDAYAIRDFDQFVAFVLQALPKLVRSEVTSYNEMRPRVHQSRNWVNPASLMIPKRDEAWTRVMHEHPVLIHYQRAGQNRVLRISDFLSARELRNMALYGEHYGPLGNILDCLPILWGHGDTVDAIGVHRQAPFTGREQALMDFLRPHLIQAHANAIEFSRVARSAVWLQDALHSSARALVVVRRDRTIEFATESARRWMREYFEAASLGERLPEALELWVRQHDSAVRRTLELPRPREPLVVNRDHRRLVVRLLSGETYLVLLLEEQSLRIDAASLKSLGLTRRESEVLAHLANGRGRVEIAGVLGMSPRTVDTHLQLIFRALGVSSRSAAAALAFRASRIGDSAASGDAAPDEVLAVLETRDLAAR